MLATRRLPTTYNTDVPGPCPLSQILLMFHGSILSTSWQNHVTVNAGKCREGKTKWFGKTEMQIDSPRAIDGRRIIAAQVKFTDIAHIMKGEHTCLIFTQRRTHLLVAASRHNGLHSVKKQRRIPVQISNFPKENPKGINMVI